MKIDEARAFITDRVLDPAIASALVPPTVKATVANSRRWMREFQRVGDLIQYMDRFRGSTETDVYKGLKAVGLLTFEDIRDEFLSAFGPWASDRTRLDDFVIGHQYRSSELVIFAGVYDNRSGGILPIGKVGQHKAVFVKATLAGGKYANEWLIPGETLKYYLKSRQEVFSESYVENAAIVNFPAVPIYVFDRNTASGPFILEGVFRNAGVHTESGGAKWFELMKVDAVRAAIPVDASTLQGELGRQVVRSIQDPHEERRRRLSVAAKRPAMVTVVTKAFVRNPDVIAEVLERASGTCECCDQPAPFRRNSDQTPYLEVHHKTPLAAGGDDTIKNAVALCPNCHRREHYGPAMWPFT